MSANPNRSNTAVFVGFTPYHLLLAEALMLQTRPSKVRLIYADEGGLFQKYLHSLPESFASTLMSMLPIGDSGGIGRARTYRSNISNLRPILSDLDGCDMYVFSPQRPESRFLLEKVSGRKIFVEDGLEAYIPAAKLSFARRWGRVVTALVSGVKATSSIKYIDYAAWDKGFVLLPHLVFGADMVNFPLAPIRRHAVASAIRSWSERLMVPADQYETILLAPFQDRAKVDALAEIRRTLQETDTDPSSVIVKPHPRDKHSAQRLIEGGIKVADNVLPGELLIDRLVPGGKLIGGYSTAVLTAAVTRPDVHILTPGLKESSALVRILERLSTDRAAGLPEA